MMEEEKQLEVARRFIQLAEESAERGNRMAVCYHFLNCLNVLPEYKNILKQDLLMELRMLGNTVDEHSDDCEDVLVFYREASRFYDCEEFSYDFGSLLLRLNFASQAAFYFLEALKCDEDYLLAIRGLNSAYCALFERWHYRMLNDEERNEAFRMAIAKKVMQGHTSVLDIGTGTGLFCWYALDAGADKIFGCDYNSAMISIAGQVRHFLGPSAANVKLIHKSSDKLSIPHDIPERVSLVVTETMDAGLLGEHLLQTVSHAWKNLLLPPPVAGPKSCTPSGALIPRSGSVWFRLVESRELARHHMFPLSDFDADSCANELANISLGNSSSWSLENLRFTDLFARPKEPYDSERLAAFSDLRYITEPQRLIHIDFNNPDDVDKHLFNPNRTLSSVRCSVGGEVHAVVAWFQVQVDENIELSSRPDGANADTCCWEQAVFPFLRPHRVVPDSVVHLMTDHYEGKINIRMHRIDQPYGSSLQRSLGLPAPRSIVRMLNDGDLIEQLRIAAEKFIIEETADKEINILDTFPVPVFGLLVIRLLSRIYPADQPRLCCIAKSSLAKNAVEAIALHNEIPLREIQWVARDDFPSHLIGPHVRFNAMVLDVLDKNGDFKATMVNYMVHCRDMLKPGGIILPSKLEVWGQMVYSEYIEKNTRVVSPALERMGVAEAINEYQVSQMLEMNLPSLPCHVRTNPFLCHSFSLAKFSEKEWKEFFILPRETGSVNAIVYWYKMHFYGDMPANNYSTFSRFSYVHQAAFVLKSPIVIAKEGKNALIFIYRDGVFVINSSKCDSGDCPHC